MLQNTVFLLQRTENSVFAERPLSNTNIIKYKLKNEWLVNKAQQLLPSDPDADGGVCSGSPFLFTKSQGSLRQEHQQLLSEEVEQFYREQYPVNRYGEVCSGCNIANKLGNNGEKGVFSVQDFPAGTRICPYAGEIYAKPPKKGKYVMEVSEDLYVDAQHDRYNVGYLYYCDECQRTTALPSQLWSIIVDGLKSLCLKQCTW